MAPKFNLKDLEQLFRHRVLRMLLARGRITREMIRMMGGCPKSTFLAPSSDSPRDRIPACSHCVFRIRSISQPATTSYGTSFSLTHKSLLSYSVPTRNKLPID